MSSLDPASMRPRLIAVDDAQGWMIEPEPEQQLQ